MFKNLDLARLLFVSFGTAIGSYLYSGSVTRASFTCVAAFITILIYEL